MILAQEDYNYYLQKARQRIVEGDCDGAQRSYNVYKELSGTRNTSIEESIYYCQSHVYVDLGLPSGTLWKSYNESGLLSFDEAKNKYGNAIPTDDQFDELLDNCEEEWIGNGIKLTGPNGNCIVLQAAGEYDCSGIYKNDNYVNYWSRTAYSGGENAYAIFYSYIDYSWEDGTGTRGIWGGRGSASRCKKFAIRLVQ